MFLRSLTGASHGQPPQPRRHPLPCRAASRARCPLRRGPARGRRTVRGDRRAGRQPHALAPAADEPVAGHHPQRDGRPDRRRPAVRPAHLRRPAAHRPGAAPVRRRPAAFRRTGRGRTRGDNRGTRRVGPQSRGYAGRGQFHAVRPVAGRRPRARAEIRRCDPAYRVRPAWPWPCSRRPGERRRPRREPGDRNAGRACRRRASSRRPTT